MASNSRATPLSCLVLLVFMAGMGCFVRAAENQQAALFRIGQHTLNIAIARTENEQAQGLAFRESLCHDCGMLFVFPEAQIQSFWMSGMRFSLDLLWVRDTRIVHIEKNKSPHDLRIMSPKTPANQVLEISAGRADEWGIALGDEAILLR